MYYRRGIAFCALGKPGTDMKDRFSFQYSLTGALLGTDVG